MKKSTHTVLMLLLSVSSVCAQEVISTQGDTYTTANAQIDFTIGEVVIDTGTDGTHVLTQGFHQTNWNFLSVEDLSPHFNASLYPNPVDDLLIIQSTSFDGTQYQMYDAAGRLVLKGKLEAEHTQLEVNSFAPGNYTVTLLRDSHILKSFKLIKH